MVKESFLAQFYGKSQNYSDIPNKWYKEYNVKKGLRNEDGTGVRIGLTRVADVVGRRRAISDMRKPVSYCCMDICRRKPNWRSSAMW